MIHQTAYYAYKMVILSEISLPELSPMSTGTTRDATLIRLGSVPLPAGVQEQAVWFDFTDSATVLHWRDVGSFCVSDHGRLITVAPNPEVDADLIAFPLLGPVLSDCLRRRGLFVLHASSVAVDGVAVTLMADKGTGKSTTASVLLEQGGRLLADDLVAIDLGSMQALSGFGQIKLSQAAIQRLQVPDASVRPHVHDAIDKMRVMVPRHFSDRPVPLGRTYALGRDISADRPRIEKVDLETALPLVLRYAYAARFGRAGLTGATAAIHFQNAVSLCQSGTVRRLFVPDDLSRIGEVVAAIRDDLITSPPTQN